jgi:hypothetical protein
MHGRAILQKETIRRKDEPNYTSSLRSDHCLESGYFQLLTLAVRIAPWITLWESTTRILRVNQLV